jgi:mono/diheme cytochrome c family protein
MNVKKIVAIALTLVFLFGAVGFVKAVTGDGNYRKGKYLFRKSCRSCHIEEGSAKVLEPLTLTQAEWTEAFSDEKIAAYACKDEWAKMSAEEINDVYTYLWMYAKDSPTPAKCK